MIPPRIARTCLAARGKNRPSECESVSYVKTDRETENLPDTTRVVLANTSATKDHNGFQAYGDHPGGVSPSTALGIVYENGLPVNE